MNTPSSSRPTVGVFAGSFDPPTNGHLFMVDEGTRLFGRLVVAVGCNPDKHALFSLQQRMDMLAACTAGRPNVEIGSFEGQFLVDYAASVGATHLLRGIRSLRDYEFERTMRNVNGDLNPAITSVFLMPPPSLCDISSRVVREMLGLQGWQNAVRPCVPDPVFRQLQELSGR